MSDEQHCDECRDVEISKAEQTQKRALKLLLGNMNDMDAIQITLFKMARLSTL